MPSLEKKIRLHDIEIHYKVTGDRQGPPLLALHGWLDNAASFDLLADELPDFQFISIDLPGHGRSSHIENGLHYHFVDMVSFCLDTVREITNQKTFLLGHSLGAALASFMAALKPDLFLKVACLEALGPIPGKKGEFPKRFRSYLDKKEQFFNQKEKTYPDLNKLIRAKMQANPMPEIAARKIIERNTKKIDNVYLWQSDPKWTFHSPLRLTEEQIQALLKELKIPTLVVRSRLKELTELLNLEERLKCVSHIQVEDISGSHHIHAEKPKDISKILRAFFLD